MEHQSPSHQPFGIHLLVRARTSAYRRAQSKPISTQTFASLAEAVPSLFVSRMSLLLLAKIEQCFHFKQLSTRSTTSALVEPMPVLLEISFSRSILEVDSLDLKQQEPEDTKKQDLASICPKVLRDCTVVES
mmetsp:Transcript_13130/g.30923  ORF Transcript_13130/g.30923 Transcript_13130/m.30923 type:complete len:132 (-) Transcript_13130:77-472(-)